MTRREEKNMVEREPLAPSVIGCERRIRILFFRAEAWRPFGFLPCPPLILRPIHRRPEMAGAHRSQDRTSPAGILQRVVNLRTEKPRFAQSPWRATVGPERPGSLARSQNPCIRPSRGNRLRH